MAEDHSRAISFAESYFSLVDGLAPGLEDHLAKNVVLDWFGRTIRGRENVAAFMKIQKISSRHVFNSINPADEISYGKSQQTSKACERQWKTDNYELNEKNLSFESLSLGDGPMVGLIDPENNNVVNTDEKSVSLDSEGNESSIYELNEDDLANLFALEITPTRRSDIEENINDIKKEESKSRGKIYRKEIGKRFDGASEVLESTCAVKYVEGNGQIEFMKKSSKRGAEIQSWKRKCKLQIAYSLITSEVRRDEPERRQKSEEKFDRDDMETEDQVSAVTDSWRQSATAPRLPSLGEITEISGNLVPNINCNFGGYFPLNFDFAKERDTFLDNFNAELALRNAFASMRTPRYVDNRLVFEREDIHHRNVNADKTIAETRNEEPPRFVFNYLIHIIIYQGNSRCRRSLDKEFCNTRCKVIDNDVNNRVLCPQIISEIEN